MQVYLQDYIESSIMTYNDYSYCELTQSLISLHLGLLFHALITIRIIVNYKLILEYSERMNSSKNILASI